MKRGQRISAPEKFSGHPVLRKDMSDTGECARLSKLRAVLSKAVEASLRTVSYEELAKNMPSGVVKKYNAVIEAYHSQFVNYYKENVQVSHLLSAPVSGHITQPDLLVI